MLYRRHSGRQRRYSQPSVNSGGSIKQEMPVVIENIPLPNEMDYSSVQADNARSGRKPPFFSIFKGGLFLDEIIIVGLILLLFDEGLEDDFLLIMLIYILLTGREK